MVPFSLLFFVFVCVLFFFRQIAVMVLDSALLSSHLKKMKKRNLSFLTTRELSVISETNSMLKNGLVPELIDAVKENSVQYCSIFTDGGVSFSDCSLLMERMNACSEVLFYICYQTQLLVTEEKLLLELVQHLSNFLVVPLNDDKNDKLGGYCEWQVPLLSIFICVQISLICSLQQNVRFLCREVDYSDIYDVSAISIGNSLQFDTLFGLYRSGSVCQSVLGVSMLSFAVCKNSSRSSKIDVSFFVNSACQCGAFSYLRLVVVPVIQANLPVKKELCSFFVEVLSGLLENVADIVGEFGYGRQAAENCVPPDRDFYSRHFDWYSQTNAVAISLQYQAKPFCIDTMEDFICLYTALLRISPKFCVAMCNKHLKHNLGRPVHSVVIKVSHMTVEFPRLLLPVIELLSVLCCASYSDTASLVFSFVEKSGIELLNWSHFMGVIELVSSHLSDFVPESFTSLELTYPLSHQNYSLFSTVGGGGTVNVAAQGFCNVKLNADIKSPYVLPDEDVEGLVAICRFIEAISCSEAVALQVFHKFSIVSRLFRLLVCSIPINLKGAILAALSALATINSVISVEIWGQMEIHKIFSGLGEDIKSESKIGKYSLTDSFLKLVLSLFVHGVPNSLGLGYRCPGVTKFLSFCIDDILVNTKFWTYSPSQWPAAEGQRWRLVARSILILVKVVQHYTINVVTIGMVDSFNNSQEINPVLHQVLCDFSHRFDPSNDSNEKEKSAGFLVMWSLLSRSVLFDFLISTLRECSDTGIFSTLKEHTTFEIGSAIDLLHKLHQITLGSSVNTTFLLSDLGRDYNVCDPVYWKERCLISILGLFYEVSLREKTFKHLVSTFKCTQETGGPFIIDDLSVHLVSSSCLSLLVRQLSCCSLFCPSSLNPYVMVIRILEQIFLRYSTAWVLSALEHYGNDIDVLGLSKVLDLSHKVCSMGQLDGSLCNDMVLNGIFHFEVIALGGDCFLDYYSPAIAFTFDAPPNVAHFYGSGHLSSIEKLCLKTVLHGNVRHSILNLMLTTFRLDYSAAHCVLMSFRDHKTNFGQRINSADYNLDILLNIMSPTEYPNGFSLLHVAPSQAIDCYELIYRLSCSVLSSTAVLDRLRHDTMKFYSEHFEFLVSVLQDSSNEISSSAFICLSWLLRTVINQLLHYKNYSFSSVGRFVLLRMLFISQDGTSTVSKILSLIECHLPVHPPFESQRCNGMGNMQLGKSGCGYDTDRNQFLECDHKLVRQLRKYTFIDLRSLSNSKVESAVKGLTEVEAVLQNACSEMWFSLEFCVIILDEFLCLALHEELLRLSFNDYSDDDYCDHFATSIIRPTIAILRKHFVFSNSLCRVLFAEVSHLVRHSKMCNSSRIVNIFSDIVEDILMLYKVFSETMGSDSFCDRCHIASSIAFLFRNLLELKCDFSLKVWLYFNRFNNYNYNLCYRCSTEIC